MTRLRAVVQVAATTLVGSLVVELLGFGRSWSSPLLVVWFGGYFSIVAVVVDAVEWLIGSWREYRDRYLWRDWP